MKSLLSFLVILTLTLMVNVAQVSAIHPWELNISTPQSVMGTSSFKVEYTTLSTESSDAITVELFQNGVSQGTQITSTPFGDSGAFDVTVTADGVYEFYLTGASSIDGTTTTATQTVTVNSVIPDAPTFGNKTQAGTGFTVNYTPPAANVSEVRIFASTARSFTANAETLIGIQAVTPGSATTFVFTAPIDGELFFALQSFNTAGVGSSLVTEPGITVTTPAVAGAAIVAVAADDGTVSVEAATTGVEDVLGTETVAASDDSVVASTQDSAWVQWSLTLLVALAVAYYWFAYRKAAKAE